MGLKISHTKVGWVDLGVSFVNSLLSIPHIPHFNTLASVEESKTHSITSQEDFKTPSSHSPSFSLKQVKLPIPDSKIHYTTHAPAQDE